MEIIYKLIPCKLLSNDDFSMEECKELLKTDLSHLIELITIPITNLGSLKIECFKLSLKWIKENNYEVFTLDENKVFKISFRSKWIILNPNIVNMEYAVKEPIFVILKLIPEGFSILLGNIPTNIKELKETLKILPF